METLTNVVTDLGNGRYRLNYRIRVAGTEISPTEMNDFPMNGFRIASLVDKTVHGHSESGTFVIESVI